jgi:hypothetical protein
MSRALRHLNVSNGRGSACPELGIDDSGELTSPLTRERDIPLTLRTNANPEILGKLGIRPRSKGIMHAMLGILGALCEADDKLVSYSRRWEWYTGQQSSYGPYFTHTNIVEAADALDHHGCIEHLRARPGTTSKWQSSMRAKPALRALLQDPATICRTDPAPLIVMRDADSRRHAGYIDHTDCFRLRDRPSLIGPRQQYEQAEGKCDWRFHTDHCARTKAARLATSVVAGRLLVRGVPGVPAIR